MLRMIIVDDERIIRETIRNIIGWDSLGIQVIGVCKNGIEAYDTILDEYPDIVLTDIKMPGLSGLELISRITQTGQETEFIILSGYGDFAFTKEAMRYGIKHYLLKPCNEKEIIEVVEEVKKSCYQKRARVVQQEQNFLILQKLHESVIHNLIVKSLSANPDFEMMAQHYERFLSFNNVSYEVCSFQNCTGEQQKRLIEVLQKYHEEKAPGIPLHCVYVVDVLFAAFEAYDYDYSALDRLLQEETEKLGAGVEVERIPFANLNELLPALSGTLRRYEEIYILQNGKQVRITNRNAGHQKAERFLEKMKNASKEEYALLVQQLPEQLDGLQELDTVKSLAVHIFLNLPSKYMNGKISQNSLSAVVKINECGTVQEVKSLLVENLKKINPEDVRTPYTGNEIADRTIAYVHAHIDDPELSLKVISEQHLFMNVDYVSKKFVKAVGCKFSAFLAKARVEKAKQLLADTNNHTVTSVAIAVGCSNNPQYFSCLFKKQTGITPTEYIKQIGG